jgi:hypothetical protein
LIHLCCAAVDELLQGEAGIVLESPDQKTRGFLDQKTRGYKLFFDSIFVIDLTRGLASTISCFRCGP